MTQVIAAAGILLYKVDPVTSERSYLLQRKAGCHAEDPWSTYEDLGGKVEPGDRDAWDTACRETEEETNGRVSRAGLQAADRPGPAPASFYNERSKYMIYVVEATPEEAALVSDDFGVVETHTSMGRVISWVPLRSSRVTPKHFGYRLRHPEFMRTHLFPPSTPSSRKSTTTWVPSTTSWRQGGRVKRQSDASVHHHGTNGCSASGTFCPVSSPFLPSLSTPTSS